jgi:glyoxylase-like metal-dependent hydrolase (beta-lactamase superfamily II)
MMIFEQFYLESLGHASYLVGDERTGRALVLDPRRDVEVYLESARMHGLRIAYAIDTHGHNDYLSGLSELRLRQDMEVLGFAGADLGYDHRSVTDGEVIEMGDLAFEVIHTPGHSPEHVSLVVYDHARGAEPVLLLAGGALLVGDVGRPDLLGSPDDVAAAARASCRTIRRLLCRLGDHVGVYPTHVRGSLCGGNIGSRLSTTVGYERRTNRSLMREHLGQALPGPPNGLADLESAGGPVASQGLTPHPAAPVPYGPTVPVSGPGRIGSSLHQPSGDQPEGRFDPLVGCSHTPTVQHRTYVLYHKIPQVRKCNLNAEQYGTPLCPRSAPRRPASSPPCGRGGC